MATKILTATLALALLLPVHAQLVEPVLSRVEIEASTVEQMDRIAERFEVLRHEGRFLEIIVPQSCIGEVESIAGFKATILEADIRDEVMRATDDEYPPIAEIEALLKKLAQDRPDFIKYECYGRSTGNYPLMALKFSDNPQLDEAEPAILVNAATHGDELITTKILLALIDKLAQGYGVDQRITRLIDENEIWIIPAVSAYGYANRSRYVGGTDPNRDYPWPEKPTHDSIPCIKHLRAFYEREKFNASIDYHAYGRMIMYPWAYTRDSAPGASKFDKLAGAMAAFNKYSYGQISKIIYVAKGSSCDYFYWKHGSTALAVEAGRSKIPHGAEIDAVIRENMDAAIYFLENCVR